MTQLERIEQIARSWVTNTHAMTPGDRDFSYMQGVRQCGADILAVLDVPLEVKV